MRHSNLSLAAVVAFVVMTLLAVPAGDALARLDAPQKCRADIDRLSSRYLVGLLRVRQRCLKKVFNGSLAIGVDCIGAEGDDITKARLKRLRERLGLGLPLHCTGINFSELGYPGGCRDTNPPNSTFDVKDLLKTPLPGRHRPAVESLSRRSPSCPAALS